MNEENIILPEELMETKAYDLFSEQVTSSYDLRMELARAVAFNDMERASELSLKLENATTECEQATEIYYEARLKSIKARRDFVLSTEKDKHPFELYELIMPIYDKEVWTAERQLSSFLNKKEAR